MLPISLKKFSLDITPGAAEPAVISVSQDDALGRTFTAEIYNNKEKVTIGSATAKMKAARPDGESVEINCTTSGSTVSFVPTADIAEVAGEVTCEIVFTESGKTLGTANFIIFVEPSPASIASGAGAGTTPSGSMEITQNGTFNVTSVASAVVNVDNTSGNIDITANGEYNVSAYKKVTVAIASGTGVKY